MASIIKQESILQGSQIAQPIAFNMVDVQTKARDYLAEVQKQAERILLDARNEAEQLRERAKLEGAARGQAEFDQRVEKAAQRLSDNRCKTAIAACEATVNELAQETSKWLALWRDQTVELAAKMSEKVLRREMNDHEETLRVWMEEALVAMRDSRDVRVLVHPDDFSIAGRFLQQLARTVPQAANVEILPDPEISLGGCLVRSSHGQIDQQMHVQLQRLVEQLT
jgi:flagellar biosynthesis/type III secretory pathway protein FliH